ncbi:hypothetical protein F5B19DRAFT_498372 [Rostrohypoxylon terebratum]|nr:hypothetical protein F5B19DRAFT_498372 [Rostrohypoxylon terebratum]
MEAGSETPVSVGVPTAANPASGAQVMISPLEKLIDETNLNTLERGANIAKDFLGNLQDTLESEEDPCFQKWFRDSAVTGLPGSGKTSLVLAVLDQPKLIPSGVAPPMPVYFAYNYSDDPTEAYRAEIQFFDWDEFVSELRDLCRLLSYEDEADAAYEKLTKLYPGMSRETLQETNSEELADISPARKRLGKEIKV